MNYKYSVDVNDCYDAVRSLVYFCLIIGSPFYYDKKNFYFVIADFQQPKVEEALLNFEFTISWSSYPSANCTLF